MHRRAFLRLGVVTVGGLAVGGCGSGGSKFVRPDGAQVTAAAAARDGGAGRSFTLAPKIDTVDLGGPTVQTWTYGGRLPGEEIRVRRGATVEAVLTNGLPEETSVHWHGIALRNDMDGMPGVTQPAIAAGAGFTYRFVTEDPGTYFFHPHSGLQLDRGLYAPLIVEDPADDGYDADWVVVLDDWLDGVGDATPDSILAQLRSSPMSHGGGSGTDMPGMDMGGMGGHGMSVPRAAGASPAPSPAGSAGTDGDVPKAGMLMGARSELLGGDPGDVSYPYHLLNGRVATAPVTFTARPGARVRIRLINAGGDTAYRVAVGGHRMTVTHTDGYPVTPVIVDALLIGMGERYDVLVTLTDGVFPLAAMAEGKTGGALGLIRTGSGSAPSADVRPAELGRAVLSYDQLSAAPAVRLTSRPVDREHRLELTGGMAAGYTWTINGAPFAKSDPLPVKQGERVRLTYHNATTMWHPMHLHGHTFQMAGRRSGDGPRKDTVAVLPDQTLSVDFDADNPGLWMIHCHNTYHQDAGMMRTLGYLR